MWSGSRGSATTPRYLLLGGLKDDTFDVGVIALNPDVEIGAPGVVFLRPGDLDPDERPIYPLPERSGYLVLGYPYSRSRIDRDKVETKAAPPMLLTTGPLPQSVYAPLGLGEDTHLILSFDPSRQTYTAAGKRAMPKPDGISGGGIWRFDSARDLSVSSAKLVAIVTDWIRRPRSLLVGYRISLALGAILERYPKRRAAVTRRSQVRRAR